MQVPNSLFTIYAAKGRSYEDICPSYYERIYREVHRPDAKGEGGLDASRTPKPGARGIDIRPYPDPGPGVNEGTRYREINSIEDEHARLQAHFKTVDMHSVLPVETLRSQIAAIMEAEGNRLVKLATPAQLAALHPSYVKFGLNPEQTRALQDAGYPTRESCIGKSLAELNMIHGIDISIAAHLISASYGLAAVTEAEVVKGVVIKKAEATA